MQTSIDAAREARKPAESFHLARAAAVVAAITLATLPGAATAAGQRSCHPRSRHPLAGRV
jgi:hypothetical protein